MRNFTFKKLAIVAIALFAMSITANGQEKGDMSVGGNLITGYGDSFTNYGIGGRFQYNIIDRVRLNGALHYFLEKEGLSMWTMSVEGHFLFPLWEKVTLYPLAGAGILGTSANWGSDSEIGLTIGGGADFKLTDRLILNVEQKYWIGDGWDRVLTSAGIIFKL